MIARCVCNLPINKILLGLSVAWKIITLHPLSRIYIVNLFPLSWSITAVVASKAWHWIVFNTQIIFIQKVLYLWFRTFKMWKCHGELIHVAMRPQYRDTLMWWCIHLSQCLSLSIYSKKWRSFALYALFFMLGAW